VTPLARSTKVWLHGLVAGVISGGASGVTNGSVASMIAPETFNLHAGIWKLLGLLFATFIIQGFMGAMAYLKQSPVPPEGDSPQT
jgi:hypothetical protein